MDIVDQLFARPHTLLAVVVFNCASVLSHLELQPQAAAVDSFSHSMNFGHFLFSSDVLTDLLDGHSSRVCSRRS